MTDPTPYTDDNVKRLAEWAHLPGVTNVSEDRQVALNLLRHGVTLPPEPDTPPEPQERYYVGDGQSDNKVYERGRAHVYAETYLAMDADRIARLLNLDESVKDDVCSGLHEAYPALVEQLAEARAHLQAIQVQGPYEVGHEHGQIGAVATVNQARRERNEARAEVERLTAELAKPRMMQSVWPAPHEGRTVDLTTEPAPQDDGPTEPLFTGRITTRGNRQHVPDKPDVVVGVPGPVQDKLNLFARVGEQVDVYRLGQRPAAPAQAVTAEMVEQAVFNSVLNDDPPSEWNGDEWGEVTSRINDQLGRTPAPPTVTAEMVLATVVKSPWIEAKRPMDWTVEEVRQVVNGLNAQIDALNRLLAERLPAAVPQDDDPAEPLFTGKVRGRRSLMGMKHLDWVQIAPAYREDFPFDRLDIDDLVDVYPHGQRPAEGDGR